MLKVFQFLMFQPSVPPPRSSESVGISGSSGVSTLSFVSRLTEDEALAQGYTLIKTAQDLDNIRNDLDGKYILMNDIDLSSYSNWDPIGEVSADGSLVTGFTGILDGNGYAISNLKVNIPENENRTGGLFVAIGDSVNNINIGEVKNLGLENVDITSSNMAGIGSLAYANSGNITNCYVTGVVRGKGYFFTGGLVGASTGGTISNCYSAANIETSNNSFYTGGIVGGLTNGIITNSYSTGEIKQAGNMSCAGGVVGVSEGNCTLSNCYTTAEIILQNGSRGGGLIGILSGDTSNMNIINNIWNTETTGLTNTTIDGDSISQIIIPNNKGLTTEEMQDPANWAGWDTDVWDFSTYPPKLKWETQSTNPDNPDDPDTPDTPDNPSAIGAIRLQVGANASADANAIIFNTSFELGDIDVDFSSSQTASNSLNGIDALLDRISKKRSEFGAIMNRLESVLNTQTSQIENLTASKSTIMDADIAQESADYVKNQILQQTTASLLAQAQSANNAVIMALIRG